jgi:putative ABC transport system permease protein
VVSAGAVTPLPLSGNLSIITFEVEGRPVPKSEQPSADIKIVTPNYFRTLAIPIKSGRDFTERDTATPPGVMIVNEAFAHRYFPGENALGKRITIGASNNDKAKPREIVAVVGNVKGRGLDSEELPEYYIPYAQLNFGSMTVCIRTAGDPHAITSAVRSVVASMDNDLPIYDIKSMEEYMSLSVATPRLHAMLLQAFAGLALLLTAVGLYGVIAYAVAQRTHEIGVRMTLGASRGNVVGMVLKSGLKLTVIGVVAGVAIAFAVTRLFSAVSSLLYGVTSTDAITFAAVIVLVSAVSLLACYIPAYRASKVDPMIALRYE